jgi:alcohol dehydrogenase
MKAVRLEKAGTPPTVRDVPDPKLKPGAVLVEVLAAHVLSFSRKLLAGELPFQLPTPYTPGPAGIGRVLDASADAGVKPGDLVFLDPLIKTRSLGVAPEVALLGWFGLTPGAAQLFREWPNGTFAQMALWPADQVTVLGGLELGADQLAALNYACIGYGGLLKGNVRAGQSVVVNGATGNLGTATVLVALALGASRVVAVGRKKAALDALATLDSRVVPVQVQDEKDAGERVRNAGAGSDLVVDAIGAVFTPETTMACISALRPGGTTVCIGGSIGLPYYQILGMDLTIRGSFMYPRSAPAELVPLIRSGQLRLNQVRPKRFTLEQISEALIAAETRAGGFDFTVLTPNPQAGSAKP